MQEARELGARLDRIEEKLALVCARLEAMATQIDRINVTAQRNLVVAEKYGDRADVLFSVVDSVNYAMNRMNPLTYIKPVQALLSNNGNEPSDEEEEGSDNDSSETDYEDDVG